MHRPRAAWMAAAVLTATLTAAGPPPAAGPFPLVPTQSTPTGTPPPPQDAGTVLGVAWRADSSPYPQAVISLRDLRDGRNAGRVVTDANGQFRFGPVAPGIYIVELRSRQDRVLAVGEPFAVDVGLTAKTSVRLSAHTPWFSGFFGNAAAAAIAAASSVGITAIGSNGLPASPQ